MAVHSTFGKRNAFGIRAWYIAAAAEKDYAISIRARSVAGKTAKRFVTGPLGPGTLASHLLKRLEKLLPPEFQLFSIRNSMENAAIKYFEKRDPRGVDIFHSWPILPRTYTYVKQTNPHCRIIQDISMEPNPGNPLFASIVPLVDIFTVPSEHIRRSVLAFGIPESKLRLVPFGVDCQTFCPPACRDYRGTFRVAFAGQLHQRKGIIHLLEAWKILGLKDAELHLYGRVYPETRTQLSHAAACGIHVHGFVYLPTELPKNLLFVLTSRQEGSAKATYEALACGLPVITTPNAGSVVRDGEDGFLIEPGRTDLIAEKIQYYYENREALAAASEKAREKALSYSWTRYTESILSIYGE